MLINDYHALKNCTLGSWSCERVTWPTSPDLGSQVSGLRSVERTRSSRHDAFHAGKKVFQSQTKQKFYCGLTAWWSYSHTPSLHVRPPSVPLQPWACTHPSFLWTDYPHISLSSPLSLFFNHYFPAFLIGQTIKFAKQFSGDSGRMI